MSPLLKDYLNKRIVIVTTEGETFVATLEGYDKNTNLVLSKVCSRFSNELITSVQLLRGSEIVVCGLLEEEDGDQDKRKIDVVPKLKDTKNKIEDEYLIWESVWKKHEEKHNK